MILRSTDANLAGEEKRVIDWFVENFGEEDALVVVEWVWARERRGTKYVPALVHIANETQKHGRGFFQNLLLHARKPRTHREAEEQLMETMTPYVQRARIAITGHRGSEDAVEYSMRELRVHLREEVRKMWPDRHRATIDGAIITATQVRGGSAIIDFGKLVETISGPDALATTAEASHGVSEDR